MRPCPRLREAMRFPRRIRVRLYAGARIQAPLTENLAARRASRHVVMPPILGYNHASNAATCSFAAMSAPHRCGLETRIKSRCVAAGTAP